MAAHPSLGGTTGRGTGTKRIAGQAQSRVGAQSIVPRDTPRPVYDSSAPTPSLSGAIQSFFPGLSKLQQAFTREDEIKTKRQNTAILAGLEAQITANPEAADRAIVTGDYSAFETNPEQSGHPLWIDGFMRMAGQASGYASRDELLQVIANTPPTQDPEDAVAQWAMEKTEESNPLYASEFMKIVRSTAGPLVNDLRAQRRAAADAKTLLTGRVNLEAAFANGNAQPTPEYLNNARLRVWEAMTQKTPGSKAKADYAVAKAVMNAAAKGDPIAHDMLFLPNKQNDGVSIMEEYREEYAGILSKHLANREKDQSLAERQAQERVELMQDENKLSGRGQAGTWGALLEYGKTYSDHGAWYEAKRKELVGILTAAGTDQSQYMRAAHEQPSRATTTKRDQYMADTLSMQGFWQAALADGMSPEVATAKVAAMMDNDENGAITRRRILEVLRLSVTEGTTEDQVKHADWMEKLIVAARVRGKRPWSWFVDPELVGYFNRRELQEGGNFDFARQRKVYLDKDALGLGKPSDHYSRSRAPDGKVRGKGVTRALAVELWTNVDPGRLGLDPQINPYLFGFFASRPDHADLPPPVQLLLDSAIEHASFDAAASQEVADDDRIQELAEGYLMGKFDVRTRAGGEKGVFIRGHDIPMATPDDRIVYVNPASQEAQRQALMVMATSPNTSMLRQLVGVAQTDPLIGAPEPLPFGVMRHPDGGPDLMVTYPRADDKREVPLLLKADGARFVPELYPGDRPINFLTQFFVEPSSEGVVRRPYQDVVQELGAAAPLFTIIPQEGGGWTVEIKPWQLGQSMIMPIPDNPGQYFKWDVRRGGWQLMVRPLTREEAGFSRLRIGQMEDAELADAVANTRKRLAYRYHIQKVLGTPPDAPWRAEAQNEIIRALEEDLELYEAALRPAEDARALMPMDSDGQDGLEEATDDILGAVSQQSTEVPKPLKTELSALSFLIPAAAAHEAANAELLASLIPQSVPDGDARPDIMDPAMRGTLAMAKKTIAKENEGFVGYVYDPFTRNAIAGQPRKKGDIRLVGHAFNVDRKDADRLLRKVGTTKARILAGETMSETQADQLFELAIQNDDAWLRQHFYDVRMQDHRWVALLDMAYQSKWDDTGPTLIGPKITAAVREGRWMDAAWEMMFNSNRGVTERMKDGERLRRIRGVELFLGAEDARTFMEMWNDEIWDPRWPKSGVK